MEIFKQFTFFIGFCVGLLFGLTANIIYLTI